MTMDYSTFKSCIIHLFIYFQRKEPTEKVIKMWFSKTNSIPDEGCKWISNWITREFDSLPWNMGRAFLKGWYIYKKENPGAITTRYEKTPCKDCSGKGILAFKKYISEWGRTYNWVCRCGSCENWRRHVGALAMPMRYTLAELKKFNVEIVGSYDSQGVVKEDVCEPV